MSTVLLSNECISWATSAAALPGYDVAYSYHTLSWLLGSDTPPLPHSQLLPCILAGQEDECLLWDELCVGIREGKGQAGVCLWSLPNVYAQAMTSMKVWMIVSFAHIRIYGRMRKVMWRASSWRLFCWSAAAFMHEKMWLCDWCWCPGKEEKTRSCWRFPDGAFSCQRSQGYAYRLQCAHLHYDWWWKMEEALHQQGRRRCLSPASSCSMTLWARGITYQELRREKPCLLTYQDSEKIFCNATRSTLGSYLGFLSSPSSFVVFENSPQSLMFSKLRKLR